MRKRKKQVQRVKYLSEKRKRIYALYAIILGMFVGAVVVSFSTRKRISAAFDYQQTDVLEESQRYVK
ncbi:MAG TPA: hypothetical protein VJH96_03705 [Patescibacteria group bacterium]|nr:hypothetical protein [Patescibacteria group bacterium]